LERPSQGFWGRSIPDRPSVWLAALSLNKSNDPNTNSNLRSLPPRLKGLEIARRRRNEELVSARMSAESKPEAMMRVVDLANGLLMRRGNLFGDSPSLAERLEAANVENTAALDRLISDGHRRLRDRLGLTTLWEAERVLSALRRARKELHAELFQEQPLSTHRGH
jgi:hypothetical protein